jgi:O-antigen/teichoic acid export membrane protein
MLASLGLRGMFIRHLAAHPEDLATALAEQLGTRLLLSIAAAGLSVGTAFVLDYPTTVIACVAICCFAMVVSSMATTFVDVLQSMHRSSFNAATTFVSGLSLTITSVVVCLVGGGPVEIALAYCVGPVVLLAISLLAVRRLCRIRMTMYPHSSLRLLRRARAFTAQQLLNSASTHVESIPLPRWIGLTQFGYFNAGTLLSTRLNAIPDGLCTAAFPLLSGRFHASPRDGVRLAIQYGTIITITSLLIALACALLSGPISRLLFPTQPALCQLVMLITIWALPLSAMDASISYSLNAAGADAAQARALVPAALCNVALTIFLMVSLGMVGACIAMPLRHLVRIVLLGHCAFRLRRRPSIDTAFVMVPPTTA